MEILKNLTPIKDISSGLDESSPYMRLPGFYRNDMLGSKESSPYRLMSP